MCRPLIGLLLFVSLIQSNSLSAHTRSESFSRWDYTAQTLSLRFTVSAREISRIPHPGTDQKLQDIWMDYLDKRIAVVAPDDACKRSEAFQALTAQPGFLRFEAIWRCSEPPAALAIRAFFDLAAEHTHFASFNSEGMLSQRLMTREDQVWIMATPAAEIRGSESSNNAFIDFVAHGFRHISSGFDHVIFLLALFLICRKTSELVWAVTGFTLGHSLTLSLAALGLVRVNLPATEALIGLTIALVAIERTARSMTSALPLAQSCAFLILLMVPMAYFGDGNLGLTTLAGLAVFSFCYLLAAHELDGRGSFRILVTALFGLVHGLGFAGAFLASSPGGEVSPWLLAGFNIGVEMGQLVLVAVMLTMGHFIRTPMRFQIPASDLVTAVVCGSGVFWFVQRSFW